MSVGTEYANRLEQWFQSAPGPVQEVLRPAFDPANELLKSVAGDPEDLIRAGERYVEISRQLIEVAEQQRADRRMLAGAWEGEGYEAFSARADRIEQALRDVAEATGSTQEVLEAAARACVEGANLIIDVIVALISFAIATFVVKAALAALTFGASMAAWVAEQIAAGLAALARISQIVARVAQLLQRAAQIFQNLARTLKALAEVFKELRLLLKELDALKKTASTVQGFFSKAHAAAFTARATAYGVTNATVLGGTVPMPLGSTVDAVGTAWDVVESVGDVEDAADRASGGGS
ncbi:MAG: WXG100 family type VII secretion target [Micromonosporaceae bacterium]|jgi:uncharacterized protein YukE